MNLTIPIIKEEQTNDFNVQNEKRNWQRKHYIHHFDHEVYEKVCVCDSDD